jgi:hypothetical protein
VTLILALGNSEQMILVSDRRITGHPDLDSDESNKATVLVCANARFAVGYTGLASTVDGFTTEKWLLDRLKDAAAPTYDAYSLLQRFRDLVSEDFRKNPVLSRLSPALRRLGIMFSGYLDHHDPPLTGCAIVSNFQDYTTGAESPEAWDEFRIKHWQEKRPLAEEFTWVQHLGAWRVTQQADVDELRAMLAERRPARAIVDKAVNLLREMSERPAARGTVGKQANAVVIPRDPSQSSYSSYHSAVVGYRAYVPNMAFLGGPGARSLVMGLTMELKIDGRPTPALFVPKVHRNAACPCRSGKRYRECHGRSRAQ